MFLYDRYSFVPENRLNDDALRFWQSGAEGLRPQLSIAKLEVHPKL